MGVSKTSARCKMEPFYSNRYLLEAVIAANVSITRYCRCPRSSSDNRILFYYTKAILTPLMSEFWQWDILAVYVFWLIMTEKKYLMVKVLVSKFVFWYFSILFVSVTQILKKYICILYICIRVAIIKVCLETAFSKKLYDIEIGQLICKAINLLVFIWYELS